MYKTRFKKWGVAKNRLKSTQLEKPASGNSPGLSRSTNISVKTKSKPPPRRKADKREIINHDAAIASRRSPTARQIQNMPPPDFYKLPEDALRFTTVYFKTVRFRSSGLPSLDNTEFDMSVINEWARHLATMRYLFSLGRNREAFQLVDICCHRFKSILRPQDLSLPDITVRVLVTLSGVGFGVMEIFFKFAYKMCQIVLGPLHPFSVLLCKFKEAGRRNLTHCINAAFQYYSSCLVYIKPNPILLGHGDYLPELIDSKFVDPGHLLRQLLPLKESLLKSHPQGQSLGQLNSAEFIEVLKCRIAWLTFYTGRHEESKNLVVGILNEPLFDPRIISGCRCYDILHKIAVAENRHDLALDALQNAVAVSMKGYGASHFITARSMATLEAYLRSRDRLEEAEKVHKDPKSQTEQICSEVRRLWLQNVNLGNTLSMSGYF
ncbi:hypothetical protein SAMD00023353_6300450 [Rosellinia necatrix]|uniref:Uncharacterized protein n=1 Tax=Rosellinia necatrix TaxID=77044 RepID=A0A1W2TSC8_ROSNE|nr:hypothetical protein SAMD00023353_6300450 [Rosellinia necatrix]